MTTLISAGNSEGTYGRCDAKCYTADSPFCNCICGGANHGVGLQTAIEQTSASFAEWMNKLEIEKGEKVVYEMPGFQRNLLNGKWEVIGQ